MVFALEESITPGLSPRRLGSSSTRAGRLPLASSPLVSHHEPVGEVPGGKVSRVGMGSISCGEEEEGEGTVVGWGVVARAVRYNAAGREGGVTSCVGGGEGMGHPCPTEDGAPPEEEEDEGDVFRWGERGVERIRKGEERGGEDVWPLSGRGVTRTVWGLGERFPTVVLLCSSATGFSSCLPGGLDGNEEDIFRFFFVFCFFRTKKERYKKKKVEYSPFASTVSSRFTCWKMKFFFLCSLSKK